MSVIIVPLAGPDFFTEKFGIRPLYSVGDSTILEYVLGQRPWIKQASEGNGQLVFVLRKEGLHTDKMQSYLSEKYPFANTVTLDSFSCGAPFSALAGISLAKQHDVPVVVDLADIAFETTLDPVQYFRQHEKTDAIVPYFQSRDPKFSYLRLDGSAVLEAREKSVISSNASAGVYVFRNIASYLQAIQYGITHESISKVNGVFFVCPTVNGLITEDRNVHAIEVSNANPVSTVFHETLAEEKNEL
jgi:hypothetical protein